MASRIWHVAVLGELLGDLTTLASAYASVDRADGVGLARSVT
ncbi:MAG: hypothetical protein V9G04_11345 [Nocardioides sp.]